MQISVRSYLTAGTAAVVATGAIAMTPIVPATSPAVAVPPPAVAEVALTGLNLSLTDVLGLLQNFGIGGGLPDILGALPSLLPTDIITAVVTEFVNQAGPLVTTAASEVFGYLGTAVFGLFTGPDSILSKVAAALANLPTVLGSAIQSLSTGDIAAALQAVTEGLAAPITGIGQAIFEAVAAFQAFVTTRFEGLVAALPGVLFTAVQTVLGADLQSLVDSIGTAITDLFGGLIPAPAGALAGASSGSLTARSGGGSAVGAAAAAPAMDAPAQAAPAETAVVADVIEPQAVEPTAPAADSVAPSVRERSVQSRPVTEAAPAGVASAPKTAAVKAGAGHSAKAAAGAQRSAAE